MLKRLAAFPISQVALWITLGVAMVATLIILPLGSNPIETSKLLLLLVLAGLLTCLLGLKLFHTSPPSFAAHPLILALVGLVVTTCISTLFAPSHIVSQLVGFGGTWLGFFSLVIVGGWLLEKKTTSYWVAVLATLGSLATLLAGLDALGLQVSGLYNFLLGLPLAQGVGFSPTGSLFIVAQLCLIATIACLSAAHHFPHQKNGYLVAAILNVLGLVIAGWLCLPGKPASPVVLPWTANWSIALDTLRNPRAAFLGIGPDNFTNAYTQFKPSWLNTTEWWNVDFTQASTLPFAIITTLGLTGFLSWLFFCFVFAKESQKLYQFNPVATTVAWAGFILVWLVPPTTLLLLVWGSSLAFLIAETKDHYAQLQVSNASVKLVSPGWWHQLMAKLPFKRPSDTMSRVALASAISIWGILIVAATLYVGVAEFKLFGASRQTAKGNYVELYEHQRTAINLNPYNDTARRSYALTNLAIASAVSNKADLSDEDVQKVAVLAQQAIREAKAAVLINSRKAQNWEVLGDIYTNFIGAMDGSDALALEAYRQAILYAPAHPNLYIKLGGVFYRQGNFAEAVVAFDQAARTKPDLANAYYNAANAFKELKDYPAAENAYQQTLLILEKAGGSSSEEYLKANLELEQLQQQQATSSASLTN